MYSLYNCIKLSMNLLYCGNEHKEEYIPFLKLVSCLLIFWTGLKMMIHKIRSTSIVFKCDFVFFLGQDQF